MKIVSLENLQYLMRYLKTKFIAARTVCDELGNDIRETYLRKDEKAVASVHADKADNASLADFADKASKDALGREIAKTYVSAAGGKVDGELHVQQPAEDDNSDKAATTSWVTTQISKAVPSKKTDGSMQTWDINVSGSAETARKATEADHAKESDHAKAADTATSANAVAWDNVTGKPAKAPLASLADGLSVIKVLGSDSAPYTMKDSDFDQIGAYVIAKGDTAAEPFLGQPGDIRVLNLYPMPRFHTLIAVSPRSEGGLAVGRFWDGVWKGWHRLLDAQPIEGATLIEPKALGEGFEGLRIAKASNNWAHLTLGCNPGTTGGLPNKTGGWFIGSSPEGRLIVSNDSCTPESASIFIDPTKRMFTKHVNVQDGYNLDCSGVYAMHLRDPRVTRGQLVPQGQDTRFNAMMYTDKDWQPYVWCQSFVDSWNVGYDVTVSGDNEFKKSAHFNIFVSPTNGARYMTTNATFQSDALRVPTYDNGFGNIWLS